MIIIKHIIVDLVFFLYHSIDQILFHTPHLKEYLCLNRTTMNPHLWIKMNKKKAVTLNKVTIYGKQTFLVVLNHKPSNINIRRTRIDLFIKPPFCSYVVLILYIIFCRVTYIQLIWEIGSSISFFFLSFSFVTFWLPNIK